MRRSLKPWQIAIALLAAAGLGLGALAWKCRNDPAITFLPADPEAEWILFPAPVEAVSHRTAMMDVVFRREFELEKVPAQATARVRAAHECELKINGRPVPSDSLKNWKRRETIEAATSLREGTNVIEARVSSDHAHPALWFSLRAGSVAVRTDENWQASFAGSAWRTARLARTPVFPQPNNTIYDVEGSSQWGVRFVVFALLSVIVGGLTIWWSARTRWWEGLSVRQFAFLVLGAAGAGWLLLFWNNAVRMPFRSGFDVNAHITYIEYVRQLWKLPLPTEGFEMFQPPLYYVLSALWLALLGAAPAAPSTVIWLRFLTTLAGLGSVVFVFLSARLLFPGRRITQLVATAIAALLPMQLYLSHYITNETLAALAATATLYLGLRLVLLPEPSFGQHLLLGAVLGLALLAKATALLLVLPLLMVVTGKNLPHRLSRLAANLAAFAFGCLLVSGWHYARTWSYFGTPLLGNWDPAAGFAWWQDPGYHVARDYLRFGRVFAAPFFSSLNGFWDGIYSTLWGDGLGGGVPYLPYRPPWNFDLMSGGYFLALVPSILILAGIARTVRRFCQTPGLVPFLLLSVSGLVLAGIAFMTLVVPSYAQIKAFYGLSALVSLSLFGAEGWELLTRGRRVCQVVVGALFLAWGINSFASVWILPSPQQHLYMARLLMVEGRLEEAAAAANQASRSAGHRQLCVQGAARAILGTILDELGRSDQALREAERGAGFCPDDVEIQFSLAKIFARHGEDERAINQALRTIRLGPQGAAVYNFVLPELVRRHRSAEALPLAREGLAVAPFDGQLHYTLGILLAQQGDFAGLTSQLGYAMLLRPTWEEPAKKLRLALASLRGDPDGLRRLREAAAAAPDSPALLHELAWLMSTDPDSNLRSGHDAIRLARRASLLTREKDPFFFNTLAAAEAEMGQFENAVGNAERALAAARQEKDQSVAQRSERMLQLFRQNRPYREEPDDRP